MLSSVHLTEKCGYGVQRTVYLCRHGRPCGTTAPVGHLSAEVRALGRFLGCARNDGAIELNYAAARCFTRTRLAIGNKVSSSGTDNGDTMLNTAGLGRVRMVRIMSSFICSYVLAMLLL